MIAIAQHIRMFPSLKKVRIPQSLRIGGLVRAAFVGGLAVLLLSSCANSKLIISPIYNRLDDQIRDEFHKLGKWDDSQIAFFEARVGTFHVWHRQQELPKYSRLIKEISAAVGDKEPTPEAVVNAWVDEVDGYIRKASTCHPVNFSIDFMQGLSDKQVNFIERRFIRERAKNFAKYNKQTHDERRKDRLKKITTWAGRIGFDFNKTQTRMLDKVLKEQVSLTPKYYASVEIWARDLFVIARKQDAPDYKQRMRTQLNKLWTLVEDEHPNEWQQSRELWRGFAFEFANSFTYDQRIHSRKWLAKMSETVNSISKNKPSFKVIPDGKYGCLD